MIYLENYRIDSEYSEENFIDYFNSYHRQFTVDVDTLNVRRIVEDYIKNVNTSFY